MYVTKIGLLILDNFLGVGLLVLILSYFIAVAYMTLWRHRTMWRLGLHTKVTQAKYPTSYVAYYNLQLIARCITNEL